jgi:signal transduction histidine kinase
LQLQTRISITLLAFASFVALIVGGLGHLINEKIEEEIWMQMLNSELEFQVRRLNQSDLDNSEKLPRTTLYKADPLRSLDAIPTDLRALETGLHDEILFNGMEVCVLVKDIGPKRYFLVFDITDLERAEHKADLAAVVAILLLLGLVVWSSVYLGRWLTRPIHDLAKRVGAFSPSELHQPIAANYSDHEVRKIAEAIDGFFVRLSSFIKREREFISMASHEFRTPLAVIAGGGDVLSAIPNLPEKAFKPLSRIKRTAKELNEMVSVLLLLAKEELANDKNVEAQRLDLILSDVVETHRELLGAKDVSIEVVEFERTTVDAPQALLRVLVSNLVRNAMQHIVRGRVECSLKNRRLVVLDTGPGVSEELRRRVNDSESADDLAKATGLGLYIVRRITDGYSWDFGLQARKGGGTIAAVSFVERST